MRILMFQNTMECYGSYFFFSERLALEMENCGIEVSRFREPLENPAAWEHLDEVKYDAIIDVNSRLPKAKTEDGSYLLDCLQGPFYNYILDHPLYHHENLNIKLENYHVLCLDELHETYIRKHYPHIRSVLTLPLGGVKAGETLGGIDARTEASADAKTNAKTNAYTRDIPVLFTGTYMSPEEWMGVIDEMPDLMSKENKLIASYRKKHPKATPEEAFRYLLADMGTDMGREEFALHLHLQFGADMYIRSLHRHELLKSLAENGIPLTVCGPGYEKADWVKRENVTVISQQTFEDTIKLMSRAKIVVSLMAGFTKGCHDRVFNAMLNGAVCLSEKNIYMEENFQDGISYIGFDKEKITEKKDAQIVRTVKWLLENEQQREEIAAAGQVVAEKEHTFMVRTKHLLQHIQDN